MQAKANQASLLTRIGGIETLDTLVGALYFNILNDPRLAHFFEHVPIPRVVSHQRQFLLMVLGGGLSTSVSDDRLANAHRDLIENYGLGVRHFDAVIENLELTLRDLQLAETDVHEVVEVVSATKSQIFGR